MTTAIPTPYAIATDTNYDAGSHSWSATPTKVAPDGTMALKGIVPGQPLPSQWDNEIKSRVNACLTDLALSAYNKQAATFSDAQLALCVYGTRTNRLLTVATHTPRVYGCDFARHADASNDTNIESDLTLCAYGSGSGSNQGIAFFVSEVAGTQAYLVELVDKGGFTESTIAISPTPTTKWLDLSVDLHNAVTPIPMLIDTAGKIAYYSLGSWSTHSLAQTDYVCLAGGTQGTFAFGPSHTAISTNIGSGSTWTEHAATWDGGAITGTLVCRPLWDGALWHTSTATLTNEGTAATTGKHWTSADGYTWVSAATAGILLTSLCTSRGWLWGCAKIPDGGSGADGHGGIELVFYDGAAWRRTGIVLSLSVSLVAQDLRRRTRATAGGAHVVFQCLLAGALEATTLAIGQLA